MLRFNWSALSHLGHVRANNEDSGFAGPYLLLVADGVGGAAAGEVASASSTYVTASLAMAASEAPDLLAVLGDAMVQSHLHLRVGVRDDPSRAGMATTMTSVISNGERFAIVHLGDSRGYLLRGTRLTRITTDHTLVQQLIDDSRISPAEAKLHPYRSVVLRSLDGEHEPQPDLAWLELREDDRLLLCSDGLSDLVPEGDIERLLRHPDLDGALSMLVEAALDAGGRDNITCVGADVIASSRVRPDGSLVGAVRDIDNLIDPAAIRMSRPA